MSPRISCPTHTSTSSAVPTELLYVFDNVTSCSYLVDCGSHLSLVPITPDPDLSPSGFLLAANGTGIKTYGQTTLTLSFGTSHSYSHTFIKANIEEAIIGIDFLQHFRWRISFHDRSIYDTDHNLYIAVTSNKQTGPLLAQTVQDLQPDIRQLLTQYQDILEKRYGKPILHDYVHKVKLKPGSLPVQQRPRKVPAKFRKQVQDKLDQWLAYGWIKIGESPYASPVHVVPKKDSEEPRITIDYRAVNAQLERAAFPVPYLRDFCNELHGCKFFSNLDLSEAFYAVPIDEEAQRIFAWTVNNTLYLPTRLQMGATSSPAAFSYFMKTCLNGIPNCFVFIDDILIATKPWNEHLHILETVFQRLRQFGLPLNVEKSLFGKTELIFLGHKLTREGLLPVPSKIEAIKDFSQPDRMKILRCFGGMYTYYNRFVPHMAVIAKPLHVVIAKSATKNARMLLLMLCQIDMRTVCMSSHR